MPDRLRDLAAQLGVRFGRKVVMKTALMKELLVHHPHRLDTRSVPPREKEKILRHHFGLE